MKTFFNILFVRLRFIFVFVAVALVVGNREYLTALAKRMMGRPPEGPAAAGAFEWYCPMHPTVVRNDATEKCPICGMPLSKRRRGEKPELPEGVLASLTLSPQRVRQAGIAAVQIGYRPLEREIRTVGTLARDERRIRDVTARVAGRIEKLHANFVGAAVKEGEPLLEIYSPEMATTVAELRLSSERRLEANAEAARRRLALWGLADAQVAALEAGTLAAERVPILSRVTGTVTARHVLEGRTVAAGESLLEISDLSRLWLEAHLFERDFPLARVGMTVEIASEAYPGRRFEGRVAFVQPTLDAPTRTVRVRVELENPDGALKPGLYVTARLRVPIGRTAEVFWGC
jgi:Cu(I)/Ag(I) efflux system membrane fusion protein